MVEFAPYKIWKMLQNVHYVKHLEISGSRFENLIQSFKTSFYTLKQWNNISTGKNIKISMQKKNYKDLIMCCKMLSCL